MFLSPFKMRKVEMNQSNTIESYSTLILEVKKWMAMLKWSQSIVVRNRAKMIRETMSSFPETSDQIERVKSVLVDTMKLCCVHASEMHVVDFANQFSTVMERYCEFLRVSLESPRSKSVTEMEEVIVTNASRKNKQQTKRRSQPR